ncbi:uncharacterized protein LOC143460496 isoform X1 [Clavelina lepadiformis]|uniref:TGF-beta family profile domain-containing protein n=1 Tax=Clavelina lepadiformis TaxID=159417 RepID=A0ABP0F8X6_CLALP
MAVRQNIWQKRKMSNGYCGLLYYFYLLFLLTTMFAMTHGKSLKNDGEFFYNCLKHRNSPQWINTLVENRARKCLRFLKSIRSSVAQDQPSNNDVRIHESRRSELSISSYLSALISWRNNEGNLADLLLDRISPCHRQSKELRKHWTKFFMKRRNSAAVAPAILQHTWDGNSGEITFRPIKTRFSSNTLIAAELVLTRLSPSDIGELFGRYSTRVSLKSHNARTVMHSDYLSSCPSRDGRFMVLEMETDHLFQWYHNRSRNFSLSVSVIPRRQYTSPLVQEPINVVERIVGLVMHFERSYSGPNNDMDRSRRLLLQALTGSPDTLSNNMGGNSPVEDTHFGRSAEATRRRRSPTKASKRKRRQIRHKRSSPSYEACHLVSFILETSFTTNIGVSWDPVIGPTPWNIRECQGNCSHPIPSHLATTNHAITLSQSHSKLCCVPTEHRTLHYTRNNDDEITFEEFPKMVATKCGCL